MAKYVCSVCGYEYDEAAGDPDNGIAQHAAPQVCGAARLPFDSLKVRRSA